MEKMEKLKVRIIRFFKWIKEECKDWRTFAIMICVEAVVYFPTWGGYLLYAIFGVAIIEEGYKWFISFLSNKIFHVDFSSSTFLISLSFAVYENTSLQ